MSHLLEGGLVIDGSGAPGFGADVLLAGDRIEAIGPALRNSARAWARST